MRKQLLVAGSVLTLIGLLLGFFVDQFPGRAVALDAHVAGVQHGMLLMILAATWHLLGTEAKPAGWLALLGLWGIFVAFVLGAVLGHQHPAQPGPALVLITLASLLLVIGFGWIVVGFARSREA